MQYTQLIRVVHIMQCIITVCRYGSLIGKSSCFHCLSDSSVLLYFFLPFLNFLNNVLASELFSGCAALLCCFCLLFKYTLNSDLNSWRRYFCIYFACICKRSTCSPLMDVVSSLYFVFHSYFASGWLLLWTHLFLYHDLDWFPITNIFFYSGRYWRGGGEMRNIYHLYACYICMKRCMHLHLI